MATNTKKATVKNLALTLKQNTGDWATWKARELTFENWVYDTVKDAKCTSRALAKAGFIMSGIDSAKCVCCDKDLCWEENDIPIEEHLTHQPYCYLAQQLRTKPEERWTAGNFIALIFAKTEWEKSLPLKQCHDSAVIEVDNVYQRQLGYIHDLQRF